MNERELLERAARAAGLNLGGWNEERQGFYVGPRVDLAPDNYWKPLTDDGDALRLAVKLGFIIDARYTKPEIAKHNGVRYWLPGEEANGWSSIDFGEHADPYAATRLAIVRAAAALAGDGSGQNQVSSMDADRGGERSDAGEAPHG